MDNLFIFCLKDQTEPYEFQHDQISNFPFAAVFHNNANGVFILWYIISQPNILYFICYSVLDIIMLQPWYRHEGKLTQKTQTNLET